MILLSDGALASRTEKIKRPDISKIRIINREAYSGNGEYQRYAVTETGVSPISVPGQAGGRYIATGLEHSETAAPKYGPSIQNSSSLSLSRRSGDSPLPPKRS